MSHDGHVIGEHRGIVNLFYYIIIIHIYTQVIITILLDRGLELEGRLIPGMLVRKMQRQM